MAKQKGVVFLEGTIGGINFYYRKGVPTARVAGGGFTKKAIKTSPTMVRVRESNNEFGKCAKVNKIFKQAIRPFLLGYKDGTLHSRLMQLFLKIKDCDTISNRGARCVREGISTSLGKQCLSGFVFTPKRPVLLPCSFIFDWDALLLSVTHFDVQTVGFPKEASFMELVFGVVCFDFETLTYTRVMAAPLVIARDYIGDSFSLSVAALPSGTGVLFAMLRVAFYQEVNGENYLLAGANAFGVEVVSVRD
ncbi:hypothetical protein KO494_12010 [Lacinutrix sp. C3R15]|uniref:hypothetical protein n=1 Tax=Flavobacteriaceae TaxID=49546 RepID=UPI001C09B47C|nr:MULTISPECIES: hypothetical protein [Flavobacteriaceae]MBU2940263.1 hypothetical protein [Lacinutrix sp. C3R15]MDO6623582.1 hypothetical protein [Oceanihabitans sp. 1_MG-2023]